MGEKRGMRALEAWCRRVTEGYRGVRVENMSTSWRNGLAFCALIHHFRPDLIDFDSLDQADVYRNNELAFRVAERHLGIPALLDAEDMVEYAVPDRLSILTYLSQFYQAFGGSTQPGASPGRGVAKRSASSPDHVSVSESPPAKVPAHPPAGLLPVKRREPCIACGLPVFLAERLLVGGRTLYHRSCFRCARCHNPLSLANCYETEDGHYCCETCPDEVLEEKKPPSSVPEIADRYSADFESALESTVSPKQPSVEVTELSRVSAARSSFMSSLMLADDSFSEPDSDILSRASSSKDLVHWDSSGKTETSSKGHEPDTTNSDDAHTSTLSSKVVEVKPKSIDDIKSSVEEEYVESSSKHRRSSNHSDSPKNKIFSDSLDVSSHTSSREEISKENINNEKLVDLPLITSSIITKNSNSDSQPATANRVLKDESCDLNKFDDKQSTKDSDLTVQSPKSLVKMRLKMFENSDCMAATSSVADKASKTDSNKRYALYRRNTDDDSSETGDKSDLEKNLSNQTPVNDYLKTSEEIGRTVTSDVKVDIISKENASDWSQSDENAVVKEEENDSFEKINDASELQSEVPIISVPSPEDAIKNEVVEQEESVKSEPQEKRIDSEKTKSVENDSPETVKTESPTLLQNPPLEKQEESPSVTDQEVYPEELNPFGDDEEGSPESASGICEPLHKTSDLQTKSAPLDGTKPESTNPFGSSDEEEDDVKEEVKRSPASSVLKPGAAAKPPRPPLPIIRGITEEHQKKIVEAPKVNLNPFWSDGEEPSEDDTVELRDDKSSGKTPVPRPRTIRPTTTSTPEPIPRKPTPSATGNFGSASSLSSLNSSAGGSTARRKKKPAPPPPSVKELFPQSETTGTSANSSRASSPTASMQSHSPVTTPRHRKKSRPAPPPPPLPPISSIPSSEMVHQEKLEKDVANRNRQSQNIPTTDSPSSPQFIESDEHSHASPPPPPTPLAVPNKSIQGQWKRKKGPAPPRPIPQRRQIKAIPMQEVRRELEDIEVQQQELERQGVKLEQTIRDKFEQTETEDSSMTPDVEELVLQLFELVNEKNELFRRQAELMYIRRQQRLEEEHADLEYQIRCLLDRPEHSKTENDKAREEELIQRLVEVVERRNEIVECLEMDRLREAEEDHSIHTQLGIFAAKSRGTDENKDEKQLKQSVEKIKSKKKSKKNKEKIAHKKAAKPIIDADKDIDESEIPSEHSKEKEKKIKKWFF